MNSSMVSSYFGHGRHPQNSRGQRKANLYPSHLPIWKEENSGKTNVRQWGAHSRRLVDCGLKWAHSHGLVDCGLKWAHSQGLVDCGLKWAHSRELVDCGLKWAHSYGLVDCGIKWAHSHRLVDCGLKWAHSYGLVDCGLKWAHSYGWNHHYASVKERCGKRWPFCWPNKLLKDISSSCFEGPCHWINVFTILSVIAPWLLQCF